MFKHLLAMVVAIMATASAWAFTSVTTLPKGQQTKMSYMLNTPRGALLADKSLNASCLVSTLKFKTESASTTDARFQFLLFQSKNETSGYYLYNVSEGKFIGTQSGNNVSLSDSPVLWYIFKNGQSFTNKTNDVGGTFNSVDYPWCVSSVDGDINNAAIAVSEWQSETGTRTSGTSWDGGNHYQVVEAEAIDDAIWKVAYDKVVTYEANLPTGETGSSVLAGELDPTKVLDNDARTKQEAAALDIINRFTEGTMNVAVILDLCRTTKGCDQYKYSADSETLTVHASSAVAACRGFYDYVKAKGAGFISWSGKRFEKPSNMACDEVSLITQFRNHQYFNVVTYGYTTPYWGKDRWRDELDWMALHGVDMPLMLVGSEAIYRKVFTQDYGLTKEDVDAWEVGPAHLPWFRMGNLSGNSFDGPLGDEWNENQRQLAHYLLEEMDKLGMKPICPAFGGFVPSAFSKAGSTPTTVGWSWCKPNDRNVPNYRLMPNDPKFIEVGQKFMQRWEEEYGKGKYYLSDSFNEMDVPSASELPQYGQNIFSIIESSKNPEAVWVTQGWTFCYQSGSWGKTKFEALTQHVPGDRFINLYMSPEYAEIYSTRRDFDTIYKGFSGKGWNYTMLPSMGGRSFWTGNLSKYAKGYLEDIYNMADPGNLVGYGMTPEGIENNELLYELITDAGWTQPGKTINIDNWLEQYGTARYGSYTTEVQNLYNMLRTTVYNTYKDDRRFAWQCAGAGLTSGNGVGNSLNNTFFNGIEQLFNNADALRTIESPLLESELIEAAAMYVAAKIDKLTVEIKNNRSNTAECNRLIGCLEDLMMDFDAALELHPTWSLQRWESMAQACGNNDAVRNAKNARRLVTVWFGNHTKDEPVQDYSCRLWSGLVRDYYCPRLINQLKSECGLSTGWNRIQFENNFVKNAPNLSAARPVDGDHIDFLVRLVNKAKNFGNVEPEPVDNFIASTNNANYWYIIRNAATDKVLTATGDAQTLAHNTDSKEPEQIWRIVSTGENTYRLESRFGQNIAVVDGVAKTYLPLVNCDIQIAKVNTTAGETTFSLTPVSGSAQLLAGEWILEEVTPSLVPEAATIDYTHYMRQLVGFTQSELFDKSGQPLSEDALTAGLKALQKEATNIDHKTFATFLQQWDTVLNSTIKSSDNTDVARLIALVMSAHQIVVPADASDAKAATLLAAIQAAEAVAANGGNAAEAHATLTAAILAYYAAGGSVTETDLNLGFANFPYVSEAPKNGNFAENSTVITLKCLNGGYLSTTARDASGNFQYAGETKPTTSAGYWVVSGDDAKGYTFYNVAEGAGKVLGFTGSEGTARAKLYDATAVPDGVTTRFKYAVNNSSYAVFLIDGTNAWNNHANNGYLALWNNAETLNNDRGSSYVIEEVEGYEFEQPALPATRTATITAVFPDGTKHVVYSNGSILTARAAAEVPQGAISTFDVESYDEATGAIVLKAGGKYLHIACGTDSGGIEKMSDSDGLSDEPNDWTTLTLEAASATGTSFVKHNNHGGGTWTTPYDGLYQIKGMCSDGNTHYFILRSSDHGWAGAASDQKFFDSNWDGNGYRTSFFEVVITEPETSVEDLIPSLTGYQMLPPIADASQLVSGKYFVSVFSKEKEGLLYGNEYKNVSTETASEGKTLGEAYVWTINVNADGTFTLTNSQGKTISVQGANGVGKHNVKYTDEGTYAAANFSLNTTVVPINGVNHWMVYQQNQMAGATNPTDEQKMAYLHCNCANPGLGDGNLRLSYWEGYNPTIVGNISCDKIAFYPAKAVYDGEATIGTLVIVIDKAQQGKATLDDINTVRDVILEK